MNVLFNNAYRARYVFIFTICLGSIICVTYCCAMAGVSFKDGENRTEIVIRGKEYSIDDAAERIAELLQSKESTDQLDGLKASDQLAIQLRNRKDLVVLIEKLCGSATEEVSRLAAYDLYVMAPPDTSITFRQLATASDPVRRFYGSAGLLHTQPSKDDYMLAIDSLTSLLSAEVAVGNEGHGRHNHHALDLIESVMEELRNLAQRTKVTYFKEEATTQTLDFDSYRQFRIQNAHKCGAWWKENAQAVIHELVQDPTTQDRESTPIRK